MRKLTAERLREVLHYDPDTGIWTWLTTLTNRRGKGERAGYMMHGYRKIGVDGEENRYKGVSWNKEKKKWVAHTKINKRSKYLGYFDTKEAAYERYCAAVREESGEFARFDSVDDEKARAS